MSFMQPQIRYGLWVRADFSDGVFFAPADSVSPLPSVGRTLREEDAGFDDLLDAVSSMLDGSGVPDSLEVIEGWGARLSAPGYMDCTEWVVLPTEEEAKEYLLDAYGEDPDAGDSDE